MTSRAQTMTAQHDQQPAITYDQAMEAIITFVKPFKFTQKLDWVLLSRGPREQVVGPAASLAIKLRSSSKGYHWTWYKSQPGNFRKQDLGTWDIIESSTHCQAKKDRFQNFPSTHEIDQSCGP